jgi:hypothetical protein
MNAKAQKREQSVSAPAARPARVSVSVTPPAADAALAAASATPRAAPTGQPAVSANLPRVGSLVGFKDNGRTPLVTFAGQPGAAAIAARATVDLHAAHVGGEVVLTFEAGDWLKPIILGVLRAADPNHLAPHPGHVEVEADGERMLVSAKEQLVLRCGKAVITLTKAGKIIIEGTYVSSRSTGVHRIKGGSIQLN